MEMLLNAITTKIQYSPNTLTEKASVLLLPTSSWRRRTKLMQIAMKLTMK